MALNGITYETEEVLENAEKKETWKEIISGHFVEWITHIADGNMKFPIWSALVEISTVTWICVILSGFKKKHRGKVLDWVDKV